MNNKLTNTVTVSVVSHGHGEMVDRLVHQLLDCPEVGRIILTKNIAESSCLKPTDKLKIIDNVIPAGFGANHNKAFEQCMDPFFCVINPDIELPKNPFSALICCLKEHNAALAAPLVVSPNGMSEDSVRRFPTPLGLFCKGLGWSDGRYSVVAGQSPFCPEWVAGMFMVFSADSFKQINGFDTRFFLYYEDVDICTRLWKANQKIVICPAISVIHAARRESHHSLRFLSWHLNSMLRYFSKHLCKLPNISKVVQ